MSKLTKVLLSALFMGAFAPLTAYAETRVTNYTTGRVQDDGGCATRTFNLGIGTGLTGVHVVLAGYELVFNSEDHHVRRSKVQITSVNYNSSTGNVAFTVNACFEDQNSDDDFQWQVYATIVGDR